METINSTNVKFTEQGLVITRGYQGEPKFSYKKYEDYRDQIIQLMNERKEHCYNELLKHINDKDLVITKDQVIWEGGHFTKCVYDYLEKWCEDADSFKELFTVEVCDQCLKQLYENKTAETSEEEKFLFKWIYENKMFMGQDCHSI